MTSYLTRYPLDYYPRNEKPEENLAQLDSDNREIQIDTQEGTPWKK